MISGPAVIVRPGANDATKPAEGTDKGSESLELRDASVSEVKAVSGSRLALKSAGDGKILVCGASVARNAKTTRVADIISNLEVKDGLRFQVVGADGKTVSGEEKAATGQTVRVYDQDGKLAREATVVIPGDVLGIGEMNISQLTRMGRALSGAEPLKGAFLTAAKMTDDTVLPGAVEISDLVRAANLL